MLFCDFAENYYFPIVKESVRLNTYSGYMGTYNKYLKPYFKYMDMDTISVFALEKLINSIKAPGSAIKAYMTFRQIIRKAQDYGMYHGDDPTKCHIKLPKTPGNKYPILTKSQVNELISGFKGNSMEACVILSVSLGLRRCECFGLKWSDIDFSTGRVYVTKSRQHILGHEVVYPPKTTLSNRVLHLPNNALHRLKEIKRNDDDWVLPVSVASAPVLYKRHCKQNNLPYTPFMNLRHTWATLQVENNADILLVCRSLGHTDFQMVYNRYVKPNEQSYIAMQRNLELYLNSSTQLSYALKQCAWIIKNAVFQTCKSLFESVRLKCKQHMNRRSHVSSKQTHGSCRSS